jgi:hypothetical protein
MKTMSTTLALLLVTSVASAETPKKPKPVVCEDFEVLVDAARAKATGRTMIGVCRDGKKPRLFTSWSRVTVEDSDGPRSYTVGR